MSSADIARLSIRVSNLEDSVNALRDQVQETLSKLDTIDETLTTMSAEIALLQAHHTQADPV